MFGAKLVSSLLVCLACASAARAVGVSRGSLGVPRAAAAALSPLWQDEPVADRYHGARTKATLAPLVTSALPEDAAWEGFVTPESRGLNALTIEYQGKLVIQNTGIAGEVVSPYLAMWNGASFERLPVLNTRPTALAVWNDHLVAATVNIVLMLDGAVWDTLGKASSQVLALGVFQGSLITGGRFSTVNGVPAPLVAAFDGSTWSAAGTGMAGTEVTDMTIHAGALVVIGTMPALKNVAAISTLGGAWQTIGTGFTGTPKGVISDGVYLYACGRPLTSSSLARWDGVSWSSLVPGSTSSDARMTRWNGKIITAFSPAGSTVAKLGQWDGTAFTTIPGDSIGYGFGVTGGGVTELGTWGTKLVAAGTFPSNGSTLVPGLLTYDGVEWATIGVPWAPGMTGPAVANLSDLLVWGGKLIAAGRFQIAADQDHWVKASGIAAWDGSHWSPLGPGLYGQTAWLGTFAGDLIEAGGDMVVLGTSIRSVARWDGTSWSALGTGAPNWGTSIAEFQGNLYVGSEEPFPDTTPSKWNGSTWSDVGGGTDGQVYALAQANGRLVVGGYFSQAGVIPASNVAFWDGANWQVAGAGVNELVATATEWLGQPVIGGVFTASGATPLPGVAIWDGAQWQPMGTRAVAVQQLRVIDGELFASGDFKLPDDSIIEDTIAHWTGGDWKVLGSGGAGYAFAGFGGYLYQAGFGLVHGHPSHNLSRALLSVVLDVPRPGPHPSPLALSASPNPSRVLTQFSFTLPAAGHARLTVVDLAGRIVATLADGPFDAGAHQARWTASAPAGVYFARLDAPGGVSRVTRVVRFE